MSVRSRIVLGIGLAFLLASMPLFVHRFFQRLELNQLTIAQTNAFHARLRFGELWNALATCWTSGASILSDGQISERPRVDDAAAVIDYVYSWLPPRCVVYPTEGFYYFATELDGVRIMGNVRVADLDAGRLGSAYFTVPEKRSWSRMLGAEDGLTVKRETPFSYLVTYRGKTVHFLLTEVGTHAPEELRLAPNERFIGQVYDESAVQFFLLFNDDTSSFYYALNDEDVRNEQLEPLGDDVWIGRRTGFAFYRDPEYERLLLIAASLEHADRNDPFDGPQDQVPFRVSHRDLLHRAYPNTRLGAGVDEHGVFLNREEWSRIAITPFLRYARVAEVRERVVRCASIADASNRWTCLTKEWWNTPEWRSGIDAQIAAERANGDR
ncbi:MAG: hypothetical protein ACKVWV_02390 [Planctomycetota bacterium]